MHHAPRGCSAPSRPWRRVIVALAVLVLLGACGSDGDATTAASDPAIEGRRVEVRAATDASPDDIERVAEILERRLAALGADVTTSIDGSSITVTGDGFDAELVEVVTRNAELHIRPVLSFRPELCATVDDGPDADGDFPDPAADSCYRLGPVALTGDAVVSARAVPEPTEAWGVDVEFAPGVFVEQVAEPFVGQQVAIVLDGTVVSAPVVQPEIEGDTVHIAGQFTESEAQAVAAALGIDHFPVALEVVD